MESFDDGGAEGGVCATFEELVEFDEEACVGVSGFDLFGGGTVASAAAAGF